MTFPPANATIGAMSEGLLKSKIIQFFYGLICLFGLLYILRGELNLWHTGGPTILPFLYWRRILLGAALLFFGICAYHRRPPGAIPVTMGLAGIAIVFFSDWLDNQYSLLRGPSIRGEIILGALISTIILHKHRTRAIYAFSFLSMIGLFWVFIGATHGNLIFSDDHPVFLQRLILLKENFPWIPFYNPLWNTGIDQRDFFATGALNVFIILAPLIYLLDLSTYYTHLVGVLLFFFVPGAVALAVYHYRQSHTQTAIGALLAVANSLVWYRWALKYGTLGFICATSLIPLVIVLTTQLFDKNHEWRWQRGALLVIAVTLMLLWSPTGLTVIPLGIWGIFHLRTVFSQRPRWMTVVGILVVNIPWILLFLSVSRVTQYVSKETTATRRVAYAPSESDDTSAPEVGEQVATAQKVVHEWAGPENPLLLFLILPAMFRIRRPFRATLPLSIIWTATLGTFGAIAVPQLELDRMLLVAGLIAAIPVSELLRELTDSYHSDPAYKRSLTALCAGFLFASPFSVAAVLLNRTVEHYQLAQPIVRQLAEAIDTYGGSGRVLFSGFVLHELSGGHLAPLVFWTHHELVASSHVHDKWRYTNVIPPEFKEKGDAGVEEYADLVNATAVIAHDKTWIQYYQRHPEQYTERWNKDRFYIFERKAFNPTFFLRGNGVILGHSSSHLSLVTATSEVVIKYSYFPFLQTSACEISKEQVSESISFIKLSDCPTNSPIEIRSKAPWTRIIPEGK